MQSLSVPATQKELVKTKVVWSNLVPNPRDLRCANANTVHVDVTAWSVLRDVMVDLNSKVWKCTMIV